MTKECIQCQLRIDHNKTHDYCLARRRLISKKAAGTPNDCPYFVIIVDEPAAPPEPAGDDSTLPG